MSKAVDNFEAVYQALNDAQRQAVDTTEGAVLVIAGPGTGKTQLLSTRAANIVRTGRGGANNILCLTYTEAGAVEMQNRMGKIMGSVGHEVAVHTFHGFGSWLIREYPEHFSLERQQKPLDDLTRHHLLEGILKELPLRHPFAQRGEHGEFSRQKGVSDAIKAFKDAGLTPAALSELLTANEADYDQLAPLWNELFGTTLNIKHIDRLADSVAIYQAKATAGGYADILLAQIADAIEQSRQADKTKPLGDWRDKHLERQNGQRVLKSSARRQQIRDLVDLYEKYQQRLIEAGLFDYEDMVLRAIDLFETNQDVVLDVAERYQYIMVDEFQDTSGAQNRLLNALLKAHPTDTPNVLAVGDDDQAIMRFQGAELSGMVDFVNMYQPAVIVLTKNYRSGQTILDAAHQIIGQTDERLIVQLPELQLSKDLTARQDAADATITHTSYVSPSAQYAAVTERIQTLLQQGVAGRDIAVIAAKHRELEAVSLYLEAAGISVNYERRESVLEEPHIAELVDAARYIQALAERPTSADQYLPRLLSASCWGMPADAIYDIAVQAHQTKQPWLRTMLTSNNQAWHDIAEWLLTAAKSSQHHNFTQIFDVLIGRSELPDCRLKLSPYGNYLKDQPHEQYVRLLSHLIRLRQAVLEARPTASGLTDLLAVTDDYAKSGIGIVDDNPILRGNTDSVQLVSGHKSKGREFAHVILLSAVEDIWGPKAKGNNKRITLPENLAIYPAGNNDVDKLRLLYVAMTRAKTSLEITSYQSSDTGKLVEPLSFFDLTSDVAGWWQAQSAAQPSSQQAQLILERAWHAPAAVPARTLQEILQPIMPRFRLSPSALKDFLDLKYSGPNVCIESQVLKFPSAYNVHSALGSAVHRVLQAAWQATTAGQPLSAKQLLQQLDQQLDMSGLSPAETQQAREHGHTFLPAFVAQFSASDFSKISAVERYLTATLPDSNVPLSGQLDAVEDEQGKLTIIDYKTGRPPTDGWDTKGLTDSKKVSLHFYRQQLVFYKLLVENSLEFSGKTVAAAELVFVEPAEEGDHEIVRLRLDEFDPAELDRVSQLSKAVYQAIASGNLPDISQYPTSLKGIDQFEAKLLDGTA